MGIGFAQSKIMRILRFWCCCMGVECINEYCGIIMRKEYTNSDVYEFLEEECRYYPDLWKEFGEGILSHTKDANFWESLSEKLDCVCILVGTQ